jgi:hypothetical protein
MDYWEYFKLLKKEPEKVESDPELLSQLDGICWSELLVIHPQLAPYCDFSKITGHRLRYLLEHQGEFAEKCDLSTIPPEDWYRILLTQPQLEKYCPQWSFRLDDWAELLRAQEHFFKRCSNICHVLISYPDLYESWKKEDWSNYRITAQSAVPYPKENHSRQEWYQLIMQDKSKCVICDCLLDLLLQYPEIFAQWCKFGTGSLYQPVYWNLTML